MIFDCDAPQRIENVLNLMVTDQDTSTFIPLPTYFMFENWLLFHYGDSNQYIKVELELQLSAQLGYEYKKNSVTVIESIIGDLTPVEKAVSISKTIADNYNRSGKNYIQDIKSMNPFSLVHILVEKIITQLQ